METRWICRMTTTTSETLIITHIASHALSSYPKSRWTQLLTTRTNPKKLYAGLESKISIILTKSYGWQNIDDQHKADLIWVRRREIDWDHFNGTRQLVNKIGNSDQMTTKGNLAGGLNAYFKTRPFVHVAPRAWRMYDKQECNEFFRMADVDRHPWIEKATHLSRGRGIVVSRRPRTLTLLGATDSIVWFRRCMGTSQISAADSTM